MYFEHNGTKYIFNEEESKAVLTSCINHLSSVFDYLDKHDLLSVYIIYLMAMKSVCHEQLEEIGEEAITGAFYRRMRLDKIAAETEKNS